MRLINANRLTPDRLTDFGVAVSLHQIDNTPTVNAIPIPDNATNGDVIKAMFPSITIKEYSTFIRVVDGEEYFSCSYRWWDTPYKGSDVE